MDYYTVSSTVDVFITENAAWPLSARYQTSHLHDSKIKYSSVKVEKEHL